MAEHKIVLASVAAGSEVAIGTALSDVLGVPAALGQQIAQSAPIVIIKDLAPEQAQAVLDAMAPVKGAGANLAISAASSDSMGELNWQSPPTVAGRALETYRPDYTPPPAPPQEIAPPQPATSTPAPAGAGLVCPHCGGTIHVQLSVGAPGAGSGPIGGPASGGLADVPDVQGQPVPTRPPSSAAPRSGPMDIEDFEKGVGGGAAAAPPTGDDLLKQLDAALPPKNPGLRALELSPPPADKPLTPSPGRNPAQKPRTPRPGRQRPQGRRRRR